MRGRFRAHRAKDDQEVNLTPMLDVVFIMLIFFIVTASFVKESGIELDKPSAKTQVTTQKEAILITIGPNDQIWIRGRAVDIRRVRANIERLIAENPESPVVINADADATNGTFVSVLDQARLAGAASVSLAQSG